MHTESAASTQYQLHTADDLKKACLKLETNLDEAFQLGLLDKNQYQTFSNQFVDPLNRFATDARQLENSEHYFLQTAEQFEWLAQVFLQKNESLLLSEKKLLALAMIDLLKLTPDDQDVLTTLKELEKNKRLPNNFFSKISPQAFETVCNQLQQAYFRKAELAAIQKQNLSTAFSMQFSNSFKKIAALINEQKKLNTLTPQAFYLKPANKPSRKENELKQHYEVLVREIKMHLQNNGYHAYADVEKDLSALQQVIEQYQTKLTKNNGLVLFTENRKDLEVIQQELGQLQNELELVKQNFQHTKTPL